MGQGGASLRCSESPGWAQPPVTGLGLEQGTARAQRGAWGRADSEGPALTLGPPEICAKAQSCTQAHGEKPCVLCVHARVPRRPELLWAHTGLAACLVSKLASGRKRRLCPRELSSGEQHKTDTQARTVHESHTHTHSGRSWGLAPVLCAHPTAPCCHPGTLLHRGSAQGRGRQQPPPARRRLGETAMGAENGVQRAQGARASEGSPERSWGVGCPGGVLGQVGQVALGGPFTAGLGWMASGGSSAPKS